MKSLCISLLLNCLSVSALHAKAYFAPFEEMVGRSGFIATVDIVKLTPAAKSQDGAGCRDLIADAEVKNPIVGVGDKKEIQFYVSCFFPCAVVSVSTGTYLVFLSTSSTINREFLPDARSPKDGLFNSNWQLSLRPVTVKGVAWPDNQSVSQPKMISVEEAKQRIHAALSSSGSASQSQKNNYMEQVGEVSLTSLRGQDARVRRGKSADIENLEKKNDAAAVDKLLEYLGDSDALVKSMAIRALGKMKAKQAVQPIVRMMEDPKENWRARLDASKTLAQIGNPEALPAIIEYLRAVCSMPNDTVLTPNTRKSYGTDKEFLASQITVHALIALVKNHPDSSSNLLEAVTGEEGLTDFKFFLAQASGQLGKKEISPILLEYLKNSQTGVFRERAASILGDLGDKNAIGALEVALKDGYLTEWTGDVEGRTPGYAVRLAAYKSLKQLGVKVQRTGDDYIVVK